MSRILVAANDRDISQLLTLALKACGHELLVARNGRDALALAQQHSPDLALLDLVLPVRDGLWVALQMRADYRTQNTPLLALSAYPKGHTAHVGVDAAFDGVLYKPFHLDDLFGWVEALLIRR